MLAEPLVGALGITLLERLGEVEDVGEGHDVVRVPPVLPEDLEEVADAGGKSVELLLPLPSLLHDVHDVWHEPEGGPDALEGLLELLCDGGSPEQREGGDLGGLPRGLDHRLRYPSDGQDRGILGLTCHLAGPPELFEVDA